VQAAIDAEIAGEVAQLLPELRRVDAVRHGDVEDHRVHRAVLVADHPRREVDDVHTGRRQRRRDSVHDAGLIGAVDGHRPAVALRARRHAVVDRPHGDHEVERRRRPGERALELLCAHVGGRGDDQHHGEVAAQDRHRRVLEVAPVLHERTGDSGDDARTVGPDGGHGVVRHGGRRYRGRGWARPGRGVGAGRKCQSGDGRRGTHGWQ
jgi:hypothetical protein